MNSCDELLNGSLRHAVEAIHQEEVSASELVQAAITRLRASDSMQECFIRHDYQALDDVVRPLLDGPLAGISVAHKDMFSTPGKISSYGAHMSLHRRGGEESAAALIQLERAGATSLGAVHMAEFAMGPAGWSEHYGFIRNPFAPDYVSGGSSSGSAAVVANKAVFASLGTDTGGSIRIPSAFCGVVGLKPTSDQISTKGVLPVSPTLDSVGPIARSVDDCAYLFDVLRSRETKREFAVELPEAAVKTLRIGWITPESLPVALDPLVLEIYTDLFKQCVENCRISTVSFPAWRTMNAAAGVIFMAEASTARHAALQAKPCHVGPQLTQRLKQGLNITPAQLTQALQQRSAHCGQIQREIFKFFDVLLCPVTPCLPPLRSEYDGLDITAILAKNRRMSAYTGIFNYLDLPVVTLPYYTQADGAVVGVQVVANRHREDHALQVARQLERLAPFAQAELAS